MRTPRRTIGLLVSSLLAVPVVIATTAAPALATHYRATQITWTRSAPTTADFHMTASYRCSYPIFSPGGTCTAAAGDTFTLDPIHYGDGNVDYPTWTITSVDSANDVLTAEAEPEHTYA